MDVDALAAQVEPPEGDELLAVVGPTASGKTALAIALAERFGGEVVGVDSVQIYRRFDVGSGKPTADERARVPYHLIDFADARSPLNAGAFAELAHEVIGSVRARGKVPIVCGGTFLWVKAIVGGLVEAAPASPEIRERHEQQARDLGRPALHARLAGVDPASAARINPNDLVRISRALEVFELTGERMSELQARHQAQAPRYPVKLVGLRWERERLARRIAARTRLWLDGGWLDEVRGLRDDGYGATRPLGSVGYRQVFEHLEGSLALADLADSIDRATRVFVRRQMTWLREEPVGWINAE